mmetsp:Transcript_17979/g.32306  ORF Transcript_17979/g.32306 Transcript_17979/m.32306 type:complete len:99 (+) Transcript_17979:101-397(+)
MATVPATWWVEGPTGPGSGLPTLSAGSSMEVQSSSMASAWRGCNQVARLGLSQFCSVGLWLFAFCVKRLCVEPEASKHSRAVKHETCSLCVHLIVALF